MAKHMVQCRVCKQPFDTLLGEENVDWVMPSRLWYFHKQCYEEWKVAATHTEEDWILLIYDLIKRDLKGNYKWEQCEAQRKKFIAQRMTNKGIYYTLYWHFLVRKNPWKEEYGIGLVPHIYQEATAYWIDKENKKAGILEQIERMALERMKNEPIILNKKGRSRPNIKAPD